MRAPHSPVKPKSQSPTAAPASLNTDELKVKIREWTATLYLTDDEVTVDSDGLNLHRDAMFQEVMSRSLAWCPKGAVPHVFFAFGEASQAADCWSGPVASH